MSTLERTLISIRAALGRTEVPPAQAAALAAGLSQPPHYPRPQLADDVAGHVAAFSAGLIRRSASVARIGHLTELPTAVRRYLDDQGLRPARLALAPPLRDLDWAPYAVHSAPATQDEQVAVSLAWAGIAESGTVVMASGPDSPITHNFVPDYHIIALPLARLVGWPEQVWAQLRGAGALPRAINLIAGPSRTADVEQTIALGAHGPRALHVVLIDA